MDYNDNVKKLAWAKPRSRTKKQLLPRLQRGVIVLKGHLTSDDFPIFDGEVHFVRDGIRQIRYMIEPNQMRFIDLAGDGGATLLAYLKENTILHTLPPDIEILLFNNDIGENGNDERTEAQCDFYSMLIDALGPPVELEPAEPAEPEPVKVFTDVMLCTLKEAHLKDIKLNAVYEEELNAYNDAWATYDTKEKALKNILKNLFVFDDNKAERSSLWEEIEAFCSKELDGSMPGDRPSSPPPPKPLFKLFLPEGAATWFVCSLEDDGDTLWVIADLGMGCVEYGTASLRDFSTLRGPRFGLPMERDKYWAPPKMSFGELLALESLQQAK